MTDSLVIPLETLMSYKNPHVINRYQKDYPNNKMPAEEAWAELMKYFWIGEKLYHDKKAQPENEELNFQCVVHKEMREIDDMWHSFLLFTIDYKEFCEKYFNHFIHHIPNTHEIIPSQEEYELELNRYLSYIYDNLGEETLKKWFAECLQDDDI